MDALASYLRGFITKDEFRLRKIVGRKVLVPNQVVMDKFGFMPSVTLCGVVRNYNYKKEKYIVEITNHELPNRMQFMLLKRSEMQLFFVNRADEFVRQNQM